jgi:hypothetical protein
MIYVTIRDRYIKSVFGKKNNSLGNGRDYDRDTKNCVGRGFLEKMRSSRTAAGQQQDSSRTTGQQDDRTAGRQDSRTTGQQDDRTTGAAGAHSMHNIKI